MIEQPKTDAERAEVAELCTTSLQVSMPTILDKIDDRVANVYAAFPDRIYVVGSDGRIAYKGQPGPSGFNVPEAMAALEIAMDGEITPYGEQPGARRARRGGRGARGARGGMPGGRGEGMGVMDADADGRISAEEWAGESDVFERFDADGDGFLTLGEVQRGGRGGRGGRGRGNPQARFQAMDADGDGNISAAEFEGPSEMFDMLDADGDGLVSEQEIWAGAGRGRGRGGANAPGALAEMDTNGDGRISREEWTGQEQMFNRRDVNEDGFLTSDEMRRGRGGRGPGG